MMVIAYDRQRTDGLTDADLVDAISTAYGPPLKPAVKSPRSGLSRLAEESDRPVARWGDSDRKWKTRAAQEKARVANKATFRP
jgi:hypothetical protein